MKINEITKTLPRNSTVLLTYSSEHNEKYVITHDDDKYFLYLKLENGYQLKKTRKKDPCFPECYE